MNTIEQFDAMIATSMILSFGVFLTFIAITTQQEVICGSCLCFCPAFTSKLDLGLLSHNNNCNTTEHRVPAMGMDQRGLEIVS
jgi:hypothetical protein